MKIRTGFVSNSSASSFCIYGWQIKPEDYIEENSWEKYQQLLNDMRKFLSPYFGEGWRSIVEHIDDYDGGEFFGIGEYLQEFDHSYCYDGLRDWHDYESPYPPDDKVELLKTIQKEFEKTFGDNLIPDSFGPHKDTYWA